MCDGNKIKNTIASSMKQGCKARKSVLVRKGYIKKQNKRITISHHLTKHAMNHGRMFGSPVKFASSSISSISGKELGTKVLLERNGSAKQLDKLCPKDKDTSSSL